MDGDRDSDTSFSTHGATSNPGSPDRDRIVRATTNETHLRPSSIIDDLMLPELNRDLILNPEPKPTAPMTRSAESNTPGEDKVSRARTTIEQAKDRAQITAATSMSIVHVALLKDTLDAGKDGSRYYEWMLGFILCALILQVLAGLLALYVALLRQYYSEYKDDFLGDCTKICCPCTFKRKEHKHIEFDSWFDTATAGIIHQQANKKTECDEEKSGCCPWECTINQFDDFDFQVLDLYDVWSEKAMKADIKCANIDAQMKLLTNDVNQARAELHEWEATEHGTDNNELLERIRARLDKAQLTRVMLEGEKRKSDKLKAQGEVLKRYVENIQKEQVLKRATFWQNTLNMMLYLVFILNAVIVGFGLATRKTVQGGDSNSTQTE